MHQLLLQPHQIFVVDGSLEGIIVKLLTLQQLRTKVIIVVHITQRYFSVSLGDPDVVLSIKQVQNLAIVRRKNQSGIVPIDRLIFLKTKYILNQRFVEVILDLVNDQIKSILERGNNKGI